LLGNLIGEFKDTNSSFRVLPEGRMEVSGQGTGKILGIDAMMFFTVVTDTIQDGIFVGDETTIITTLTGESVIMKFIQYFGLRGKAKFQEVHLPRTPNHRAFNV